MSLSKPVPVPEKPCGASDLEASVSAGEAGAQALDTLEPVPAAGASPPLISGANGLASD